MEVAHQPNISILIITYNRPVDTLELLKSLKEQDHVSLTVGEILILNNASTVPYDNVLDFIQLNPSLPVQFIDLNENLGVAKGRNYLIERSRYPVLMVLDDDVVFQNKDAFNIASKIFDEPYYVENNTAVITMNIFYYQTGERQPSALPHKEYKKNKDKARFLTYYFTGAAHLMKKELFDKTGLYPPDFFYGMEEYDLSYRIIAAGYTLAYDSRIKVLHKESPLGRVPPKEKLQMMWYNKCVVAYRYLPQKYFYTTAMLWAGEYLAKTKGDINGVVKMMSRIRKIPKFITRNQLDKKALNYLQKVRARLHY